MADLVPPEKVDVVAIPFHGEKILTVDVDGNPHIVLKPVLESIGLDYWGQVAKLRGRSWAVTGQRPATGADGKTYQMVTCDVQTFLMLLATIDENRVGVDVKPKLVLYQREVARAIEDYWTKGKAINPRATAPAPSAARQLLQTAQLLVDHEERIAAQEREVKQIRGDVDQLGARMDGIEQKTGWVSALGFSITRGLRTDNPSVAKLGKAASQICRARTITPGRTHNEVFGEVNTYPIEVLEEAAGMVPA